MRNAAIAILMAGALSACGGGGGSSEPSAPPSTPPATPPAPPPAAPAGDLQFDAATYSVGEGATSVAITVTRTGGSRGAVSVNLAASDATATGGEDYGTVNVVVSFGDGDTTAKSTALTVLDDADDEPDETVNLTLSAPTGGGALGAVTSAVLTIVDDDVGPPLQSVVFERDVVGQSDLHLIKEDGSGLVVFAGTTEGEAFAGVTAAGRLVFSRSVGGGGDDLFSVNADGSGELQLTATPDIETVEAIAPDGRIIFRRLVGGIGGHDDLYAINADGTALATLANTADDEQFEGLSPDGRVIFRRLPTAGGNVDLFSVKADGTAPASLATTSDFEDFEGITPAGRVIFRRDVAGAGVNRDIYSVNADGSGLIALAVTTSNEDFDVISAAGQVIFRRNQDSVHRECRRHRCDPARQHRQLRDVQRLHCRRQRHLLAPGARRRYAERPARHRSRWHR